jgi:hypothetical protein|tara:strand:- start:553 stop:918 length:366 start_codon:yes stop_codon:yes gene_type:complete
MDEITFNRCEKTGKLDCRVYRDIQGIGSFVYVIHQEEDDTVTGDIPAYNNKDQIFSHEYFLDQMEKCDEAKEHIRFHMDEFLNSIAKAQEIQRNKVSRLIETTATSRQLAQILGILEMNED